MRKLAIRIGKKQFGTYQDYLAVIARIRWPDGFHFLRCGHDHATVMQRCCQSDYDALPSDCTLLENTRLPLMNWLAATYLMTADQGIFGGLILSVVRQTLTQTEIHTTISVRGVKTVNRLQKLHSNKNFQYWKLRYRSRHKESLQSSARIRKFRIIAMFRCVLSLVKLQRSSTQVSLPPYTTSFVLERC